MKFLHRIPAAVAAAALVTAFAGVVPAGAQAEPGGALEIQSVDATAFPMVRAVVSGPPVTGELDDAFVVVEDGEERPVNVVRLRANDLNVTIALDVSGSMEGEPLAQAKAAVAELLATLPEEVPVSIVSFGESALVTSDFSTDRAFTLDAVDRLIAAGATTLYDGVHLSLRQLAARGGTGALVVLADGDDTASGVSLEEVQERLGTAGVATSFVALQTDDFNGDIAAALAGAGGGQVLTVDDTSQLGDAFRDVGAGLGNLYELRWRSASDGAAGDLSLALATDSSVSASTTFEHPTVRQFAPDIATETRTVAGGGLFAATWIPYVAALFVSAGAVVLIAMMRASEGAAERREARQAARENTKSERSRRINGVQEKLNDFSAHVLETNDRGRSLDDTLDRAGLKVRSNEFVVFCAGLVIGSLFLGVLLFGIPYFLLGLILPVLGIPFGLKFLASRRRKKFVAQLGDTLQLMAGSLTAGYGLGQTLDSVARETDSPTNEEFSRVVMETRLGRSLEDALDAMSKRINAPDFDWVVDAIKIQSSVGGNLSEIITQVGETIRARTRIRRQVDALTAEGKISALVLFVLPFGLMGFITMSNPDYIKPLFSGGIGYAMLGAAGTMMAIGGLWLKKLVNPEF